MPKNRWNKTSLLLMKAIKKIAITGPESTGKSTLSVALANYYKTAFVPEYAREYIDQLNRPYTLADIVHIAQQQVRLEKEKACVANQYLICDTDLIVTKIWSEHAFEKCPTWITAAIQNQKYDLHLLMNVDIDWVKDEQREHPHLRQYFFERYQQTLEELQLPYQIISGKGQERVKNAIQAIKNIAIPQTKPMIF